MPTPWEFWFASEVTGSGDVASGVSVAGQASETFAAAGAVATPSVVIAGTAAETFAGSGNVAVSVSIAGTGAQTFVGSGTVAVGISISGTAHSGEVTSVGGAPALPYFVPFTDAAISADGARRERDRKRRREKVRAEAQAIITVAMAAVLDHQRQLEEDDWLLGLADDYVRRAA
jgi:hypothetical protein